MRRASGRRMNFRFSFQTAKTGILSPSLQAMRADVGRDGASYEVFLPAVGSEIFLLWG
jgi:hypothetical protein